MHVCAYACMLSENTDLKQISMGLSMFQFDSLEFLKLNRALTCKTHYPLIFPKEIFEKSQGMPFDPRIQE